MIGFKRFGSTGGGGEVSRQVFTIYTTAAAAIDILLSTIAPVRVNWGDGTTEEKNGTDQTYSKTYAVAGDYAIQFLKKSDITKLQCTSNVFFHFDIANAPAGITYFLITGQNTVSGDIANAPAGITYFLITGQNTVSGDIANAPAGITYFSIAGQNTVSGDIANAPAGITVFYITGQNTVSGDIANAPAGITYFLITGQNTVSGDIANAPAGITFFNIQGQNTVTYTTRTWPSVFSYFYLRPANTGIFTTAMVDKFLIDMAASITTASNEKAIDLRGNCGARTAASDTAVIYLQGIGFTVYTN